MSKWLDNLSANTKRTSIPHSVDLWERTGVIVRLREPQSLRGWKNLDSPLKTSVAHLIFVFRSEINM